MKSFIVLMLVVFAVPAFSKQATKFQKFVQIGKKPNMKKMSEEPGRLDVYYIAGVGREMNISIPKTGAPNLTCKNYAVFDVWAEAIGFRSLPKQSEHIFGYASADGCYESDYYVQLKVQAGMWALDEEGNQIVADAAEVGSKNTLGEMPIQWQTPRHMLTKTGIILRTSMGRAEASFFTEVEPGFEKRETYRESKKLETLITTLGKREALEKYFDGRVKDTKALNKLLGMAENAQGIWFVVNEVPEYFDGDDSDFHGWSFTEGDASAYYKCDNSGCVKN